MGTHQTAEIPVMQAPSHVPDMFAFSGMRLWLKFCPTCAASRGCDLHFMQCVDDAC